MSSASKASSKSSKTSKASDSDSEMEKQDKHSVFNGDIKKNSAVAKFFLKFINGISNDLLEKLLSQKSHFKLFIYIDIIIFLNS